MAFNDMNPQGPVHFLVIPKQGIASLAAAQDSDAAVLGHLLVVAKNLAAANGLAEGYRTVINTGPNGAQSVYHIHLHVIGGRQVCFRVGSVTSVVFVVVAILIDIGAVLGLNRTHLSLCVYVCHVLTSFSHHLSSTFLTGRLIQMKWPPG